MSAQVTCKYHPDAGDQICSECGLVVGDRVIDVGSEWRTFSSESGGEDKSRVGGPENALLGGSDLYTMIGTSSGPAGFDMPGNQLYNNRRTVSSSDRTLINAFRTISNMADRINLTKTITDRTNKLFKTVHDGKNLKGRSNEAIAAACLYIACRQEGVPRTFKEIVAVSSVSKRDIGRCFKRGPHHHGRLHVEVLRQLESGRERAEGREVHRQEGHGPRHRVGKVSHLLGRRSYLFGQPGFQGQENSARDCGYRWSF